MNGFEERENEYWEKVLKTFSEDGYIYVQPLKLKYQKELASCGSNYRVLDSYVVDRMTKDNRYDRFNVPICSSCMMPLCPPEESDEFDMDYCDSCEASLEDNIHHRIMFRKKAGAENGDS